MDAGRPTCHSVRAYDVVSFSPDRPQENLGSQNYEKPDIINNKEEN